jgi:hypothetical protein
MKNPTQKMMIATLGSLALTLGVFGAGYLSNYRLAASETANRTILLSAGYNYIEHSDIVGRVYHPMSEQISGGNVGSYVDVALGGLNGNYTWGKKTDDYYLKWTNLSNTSNSYMMFFFNIHNVLSFDLKYIFDGGRNHHSFVTYCAGKNMGGKYENVTIIETSQIGEGEVILDTSVNNLSFTPESIIFSIHTTTSGTACSFTFKSLSISYGC